MNTNNTGNSTMNQPPPIPATNPVRKPATLKVSFPMERAMHDEITASLEQISSELGLKLSMPAFLKKTVTEGWKLQAERYRKLNASLKR